MYLYSTISFRGDGARQCATDKREERKPGRLGMSSLNLNSVTESLLMTVFVREFQTAGAEHQ